MIDHRHLVHAMPPIDFRKIYVITLTRCGGQCRFFASALASRTCCVLSAHVGGLCGTRDYSHTASRLLRLNQVTLNHLIGLMAVWLPSYLPPPYPTGYVCRGAVRRVGLIRALMMDL